MNKKWVGKTQRRIIDLLDSRSLTRFELMDEIGQGGAIILNALLSMENKGIIVRVGSKYTLVRE